MTDVPYELVKWWFRLNIDSNLWRKSVLDSHMRNVAMLERLPWTHFVGITANACHTLNSKVKRFQLISSIVIATRQTCLLKIGHNEAT